MIFRYYIHPLANATGKAPKRVLQELFFEAGCKKKLTDSSLYSWLAEESNKKYRCCDAIRYFSTRKIEEEKVISYFQTLPHFDWQSAQKEYAKLEKHDYIDIATDKQDVFFWSLLRQFQAILGLNLSNYPDSAKKGALTDAKLLSPFENEQRESSEASTPVTNLAQEFCAMIEGFSIEKFLETEPTSLAPYQVEDAISATGHLDVVLNEMQSKDNKWEENIASFAECLTEYLSFLKNSDFNSNTFPDNLNLPNNDPGFTSEADQYKQRAQAALSVSSQAVREEIERRKQNQLEAMKKVSIAVKQSIS